jgi:hypothetical protein
MRRHDSSCKIIVYYRVQLRATGITFVLYGVLFQTEFNRSNHALLMTSPMIPLFCASNPHVNLLVLGEMKHVKDGRDSSRKE